MSEGMPGKYDRGCLQEKRRMEAHMREYLWEHGREKRGRERRKKYDGKLWEV